MSRNYVAEIAKLYGLKLNEVFRLTGHKDMYIFQVCLWQFTRRDTKMDRTAQPTITFRENFVEIVRNGITGSAYYCQYNNDPAKAVTHAIDQLLMMEDCKSAKEVLGL